MCAAAGGAAEPVWDEGGSRRVFAGTAAVGGWRVPGSLCADGGVPCGGQLLSRFLRVAAVSSSPLGRRKRGGRPSFLARLRHRRQLTWPLLPLPPPTGINLLSDSLFVLRKGQKKARDLVRRFYIPLWKCISCSLLKVCQFRCVDITTKWCPPTLKCRKKVSAGSASCLS